MAAQRVLIVVAAEVSGAEVRNAVSERARGAREVRVVAPALTDNVLERTMGNVDDAIKAAQARLDRTLQQIGEPGVVTTGAVGDSDLRLAIQDALQTFDAGEIVIVTHRDEPFAQEPEGIADAEKSFEPPITKLYVTGDDGSREVAEVEKAGAGVQEVDPGEVEPRSRNLPPFGLHDLAGILVAVIGTGALFVLAANCETIAREGFDSCAARLLLAGGFFLVNLAHVVGLTLFQAGPYRGFWRKFFARSSLIGTPIAVLVSAVVLG